MSPPRRRGGDYSPRGRDDRRERDYDRRDRSRTRTPDDRDHDRDMKDRDRDDRDVRENGTADDRKGIPSPSIVFFCKFDSSTVESPPPAHDDLDTAE